MLTQQAQISALGCSHCSPSALYSLSSLISLISLSLLSILVILSSFEMVAVDRSSSSPSSVCTKRISQPSVRFSTCDTKAWNQGSTLQGMIRNSFSIRILSWYCSSVQSFLPYLSRSNRFLCATKSRMPRLWSECMCVMKITLVLSSTRSMSTKPKWLYSWQQVPSPQSSSTPWFSTISTQMLLTLRYLLGFIEPVPRNTTCGSMSLNPLQYSGTPCSNSAPFIFSGAMQSFLTFSACPESAIGQQPWLFFGASTNQQHLLQQYMSRSGKASSHMRMCLARQWLTQLQCWWSMSGMQVGQYLCTKETSSRCCEMGSCITLQSLLVQPRLQTRCFTAGANRLTSCRYSSDPRMPSDQLFSAMWMTLSVEFSGLVMQAPNTGCFMVQTRACTLLWWRMSRLGLGESGSLMSSALMVVPSLRVRNPQASSFEISLGGTFSSLIFQGSTLPSSFLKMQMQLKIFQPLATIWKGTILTSSSWYSLLALRYFLDSFFSSGSSSVSMYFSLFRKSSGQLPRLSSSRTLSTYLTPVLVSAVNRLEQEQGRILKPILYRTCSMQWYSSSPKQSLVSWHILESKMVSMKPLSPASVSVLVLVKKITEPLGNFCRCTLMKRWKHVGMLKMYFCRSVLRMIVGISCFRQFSTSCTQILIALSNNIHLIEAILLQQSRYTNECSLFRRAVLPGLLVLLVFFVLLGVGRLVELDGQGRVGVLGQYVGAVLQVGHQIGDVFEGAPAAVILEGQGTFEALHRLVLDIQKHWHLAGSVPDEAGLDLINAGQLGLAQPLLDVAGVGLVLFDGQCSRGLHILDPGTIALALHQVPNQHVLQFPSGGVPPGTVNLNIAVHIDAIEADLEILADFLQLLWLLVLFALLALLLLWLVLALGEVIGQLLLVYFLTAGQQVMEHLVHFGGGDADLLQPGLIGGHVVGGVLVGDEQIEVGQPVILILGALEVLQHDHVSVLLDLNVPGVHAGLQCQYRHQEGWMAQDVQLRGILLLDQSVGNIEQHGVIGCLERIHSVGGIFLELDLLPGDALHLRVQVVQLAHRLDVLDLELAYFGDVLQGALVDSLDFLPVVLHSNLLEVGLDLVGPVSVVPLRLLVVAWPSGRIGLPIVIHSVILRNKILVLLPEVLLHYHELLVLARLADLLQVAVLQVPVEGELVIHAQRQVIVLLALELPVRELVADGHFEILQQAEIQASVFALAF